MTLYVIGSIELSRRHLEGKIPREQFIKERRGEEEQLEE